MKTALWIPLLALAVAGCIHGRSPAPDAAPFRLEIDRIWLEK